MSKRATSTSIRKGNGWHKGFVEKTIGDTTYISVVFSWDLLKAFERFSVLKSQGVNVLIGGAAASYAGVASCGQVDAVPWHNPNACRFSTGCVNKCGFCIIPIIEGDYREKLVTDPKPIVYDNNPTSSSKKHFDYMIDSLKPLRGVDFNQGVSCLSLTSYHASRFAELDMKCVRLAWDTVEYERHFIKGWSTLRAAGFPSSKIGVYVLIGYNDTPDDALYRLETVRRLGCVPFPMRYQPLNTPKRNSYAGENWTHQELVRYCRYWANLRITNKIPFKEFRYP